MQEQYIGDAGDFVKFALLRRLSLDGLGDMATGIGWYLVPDESHLGDGRHVGYLTLPQYKHLQSCDPVLFSALLEVVTSGKRTLEVLRSNGVLDRGWLEADEHVPLPRKDDAERRAWFANMCDHFAGLDIVLLDPDNGLRPRSTAATGSKPAVDNSRRRESIKFAWYEEVADLARRDHSLVIYQHRDRTPNQSERIAEAFAGALGAPAKGWRVVSHLYSQRSFYVLPHPRHEDRMNKSLSVFADLDWRRRVSVERLIAAPLEG
ncbi:MAG: hypothetical protein JWM85_3246 [Acidimicrobiaceae bacterium]|nr:hypothetical protein [Acidimicrobiaceae bacterium]